MRKTCCIWDFIFLEGSFIYSCDLCALLPDLPGSEWGRMSLAAKIQKLHVYRKCFLLKGDIPCLSSWYIHDVVSNHTTWAEASVTINAFHCINTKAAGKHNGLGRMQAAEMCFCSMLFVGFGITGGNCVHYYLQVSDFQHVFLFLWSCLQLCLMTAGDHCKALFHFLFC